MKRILGTLTGALVVLLVTGVLPVTSQDSQPANEIPTVPAEIVQEYLTVLKQQDFYRAARSMPAEDILTVLDKVADETGLTIEHNQHNFLNDRWRQDYDFRNLLSVDIGKRYSVERTGDESDEVRWVLSIVNIASGDGREASRYTISVEDLSELDFDYISKVEVIHPLLDRRYSCKADNVDFSSWAAGFCASHGVNYTIAGEQDEKLFVSRKQASFVDCIEDASNVVRRKVYFSPVPTNRGEYLNYFYKYGDPIAKMEERVRLMAGSVRYENTKIKIYRKSNTSN